jgi:alpha-tubulin suppressor-like RCC1 family protein
LRVPWYGSAALTDEAKLARAAALTDPLALAVLAGAALILGACGSSKRDAPGEPCQVRGGASCSGYCLAAGTYSSCEGGGVCIGPAAELTCAFRCQSNGDCAGHSPATACTYDCQSPSLDGFCVDPGLPARASLLSFPCSVTPPATDGGVAGDGGAPDGPRPSTLGTPCAPVCTLPICVREFIPVGPDTVQITSPAACGAACITSTGSASYCTRFCTSDSDCVGAGMEMRCVTSCARDPSSPVVGLCWSAGQHVFIEASCNSSAPTDGGAGADASNGCQTGADCPSGYCDPMGRCRSTCGNGVRDGMETDADCGGAAGGDGTTCPRCADDRTCAAGADCQSGFCSAAGRCLPPCTNGVKDGAETDVDCGGTAAGASVPTCAACADGKVCATGPDCASRYCAGGRCAPQPATSAVAAGGSHSCVLFAGGQVKCWGSNTYGQLGLGDTSARGDGANEMGHRLPALSLGTGRAVRALSGGSRHTCALLEGGQVKCWGDNSAGQLGLGDTSVRGDGPAEMGDSLPEVALGAGRTATAVAAGGNHTCALLNGGQVKCWGDNFRGQLGLGNTVNRGDGPGEMGDSLPAVDLGTGRAALAIAVGANHTCALLDNGQVKCWGENNAGQTGVLDEEINTARIGDNSGEMGDNLPPIDLGSGPRAVAIEAGANHACALLENRQAKCWGNGGDGQLGLGDGDNRGDDPGELGDALPAVAVGGAGAVLAVAAGSDHTCALLDGGGVKCWGDNLSGRLGIGDTEARGDDAGELGDSLPAIMLGGGQSAASIAVGAAHACALLGGGGVKCWGENISGQLGLGNNQDRGDEPGEMGDNLPAVALW